MACADVDMEIYASAEEPGGAESGQPAVIWSYRPLEVVPEPRGPLHNLQKLSAAFGVRTPDTHSTCSDCPSGPSVTEFTEMEAQ